MDKRSLEGYSPEGCKESNAIEQLILSLSRLSESAKVMAAMVLGTEYLCPRLHRPPLQPNSYVRALTLNVTIFGDGAFGW